VWWEYIIIAAVLLFGIYAFLTLTGFETQILSRRTNRRAESMYSSYADPSRRQRRHARRQGRERKSPPTG
jgi:hypothetical protein